MGNDEDELAALGREIGESGLGQDDADLVLGFFRALCLDLHTRAIPPEALRAMPCSGTRH